MFVFHLDGVFQTIICPVNVLKFAQTYNVSPSRDHIDQKILQDLQVQVLLDHRVTLKIFFQHFQTQVIQMTGNSDGPRAQKWNSQKTLSSTRLKRRNIQLNLTYTLKNKKRKMQHFVYILAHTQTVQARHNNNLKRLWYFYHMTIIY